jgi:hypothetical protein
MTNYKSLPYRIYGYVWYRYRIQYFILFNLTVPNHNCSILLKVQTPPRIRIRQDQIVLDGILYFTVTQIWDRRSLRESNPQPVGVLAGHTDGITYLDTRGDGRFILSNSKDQVRHTSQS